MPRNWRSKAILSAAITLISIYFLVPTFAHFDLLRERAEKGESPLPFYTKLFPEKQIALGLDLRGGLYVEMEVQLDEAIKNRADILTSEVTRFVEKEPFAPAAITREPDGTGLVVTLKEPVHLDGLLRWIADNYNNVLVEKRERRTENGLTLDLTEQYVEHNRDLTVRQALETVRNRIDRYGVTEPSIVRLGSNRISIELPGMTEPERALNIIKSAGKLEFKMVDESVPDEEVRRLVAEARERLQIPEGFSAEVVEKINADLKGKVPADDEILFEVSYDPVSRKVAGGEPYLLKRKAEITGDMLKNAQVNIQNNEPYVSLSLNNAGARLFADLTRANIGKRLAIILDGTVSKAPVIKSEIPGGEAQITLGYGDYQALLKEAEDLTLVLREGALPASLKELTKTVVGPSLGHDSIQRGIKTSLAAGLLIVIFMVFYYRLSGLLADIALTLNIFFTLGALAIFQATLTLPGIAGIVLTIGMAVDANVLIFERMREELRAGRTARAALDAGYKNAMSAILDSNITTFLSGVVLYQFGTGPIRGFAVTLMIGIATTLFTAIVVTRVFQEGLLFGLKRERLSV